MAKEAVKKAKKAPSEPAPEPTAQPLGRERRKHERAACDGFAEVVIDGASLMFRGRIKDLSPTGCYIETRARLRLEVGTAAELCFTVNERAFKAVAEVRVIRPGSGVGFEILFLVAESREPSDLLALIQKLESR
jgi:PilZ domain